MSESEVTDELVRRVADDLKERYQLDEHDVRFLGARLAEGGRAERRAENLAFAERFTEAHRETFDRLAR